jgi:hypothetical protein
MSETAKSTGSWLGYFGGGFSVSLIGGGSAYQMNLWNTGGGAVPMPVLVTGMRAGIVAQAETGHAFCYVYGVKDPADFKELKSQGFDWCFSVGGKADAVAKGGSKAWKLLKTASKSSGNWAAQESAKKGIQALTGDFDINDKGPGFILLPSPLAVGLGAGVFYEWQTLRKVGTDVAWRYVKPTWYVHHDGKALRLYMYNIPEADGKTIALQLLIDVFGADDIMTFKNGKKNVLGTVRSGELCDYGTKRPGINLSALQPSGKVEIGMLTTSQKTTVTKNGEIGIGVGVCRNASSETNLYKWESSDYVKIKTDGEGRFASTKDSGFKN